MITVLSITSIALSIIAIFLLIIIRHLFKTIQRLQGHNAILELAVQDAFLTSIVNFDQDTDGSDRGTLQ